jgi:hypothetical protein
MINLDNILFDEIAEVDPYYTADELNGSYEFEQEIFEEHCGKLMHLGNMQFEALFGI